MKFNVKKITLTVLAAALLAPAAMLAQQGTNSDQKEKDKTKEKKDVEQIIITRKGGDGEKMVVEVNGDKVLINGKEVKDNEGDITVRRNKIKDVWSYGGFNSHNGNQNFDMYTTDSNRPMLGVTTEKTDEGAEIEEITKESAAEKAGLKKGDIITKVNETKIETPDDLSAAIKKSKPGDKVSVTYLRDKKEQKATAELTKWKGMNIVTVQGQPMFDMEDFKMEYMPKIAPQARAYSMTYNRGPKLGISVQDAENGKGVKVLSADDDGLGYKSGIRENDVITDVDGKAVNSADEVAKIIRDSKDKVSVKMKLLRAGKVQTVDVKIPRKLKTADL